MLESLLENYEGSNFSLKPNKLLIPVTLLKPNCKNVVTFNELLKACKEEIPYKIVRTKSGSISYKTCNFKIPAFDYTTSQAGAEITIIGINCKMYRIQFRALNKENEEDKLISGHKAYLKLQDHLKKYNINLKDYYVDNGEEINAQTEKYMISASNSILNITWRNAHHIDFHSSFPAGLVNTHPEFKDAINDLYLRRKKDPICKAILNFSIGYFHSKLIGYKLAVLSRDAINDNNKRIRQMMKKLKENGNIILALNTDGIWYAGKIYHDENEGPNLGQWANDHINCQWRAKSAGAYEFIENDQYFPVIRGYTNLDKIKSRDEWRWGDIYQSEIIQFTATEEGIIYAEA